jgi:hypothetical protein
MIERAHDRRMPQDHVVHRSRMTGKHRKSTRNVLLCFQPADPSDPVCRKPKARPDA